MRIAQRVHFPFRPLTALAPRAWSLVVVGVVMLGASGVHGQPAAQEPAPAENAQPGGAGDLALQLSNPVASLVSVPLQFNWDYPVGIDEDTRFLLNFQPVIPLSLSTDWNLIVRWIMPYLAQPSLAVGVPPTSGLSDITASLFISPSKPKGFIWAAGPVLLLPATSDPTLGSGKVGAGPTVVVLKQVGGWSVGALANHVWSVAGDE